MTLQGRAQRWITGLVLAGMLAATLAPVAEAGNRKVRYKGGRGHYREARVDRHYGGSRYIVRRSNTGPVIAGFIGGLFLGATLANAAPAGYSYYDPYCRERFATLDSYHRHCGRHGHAREIRVVEVRRTTRYVDHGGYDDGYHDEGYDRRYRDRDYRDQDYEDQDWRDRDRRHENYND